MSSTWEVLKHNSPQRGCHFRFSRSWDVLTYKKDLDRQSRFWLVVKKITITDNRMNKSIMNLRKAGNLIGHWKSQINSLNLFLLHLQLRKMPSGQD